MLELISRWVDQMGNVHGRADGMNANVDALLIGSHLVMVIPYFSEILTLNVNYF